MKCSTCILLAAGLLLALSAHRATAGDWAPPSGWGLPPKADIDTEPFRHESPSGFVRAYGDFDGDEAEDTALLLVPDNGQGYGVFVFRGDGHGNFGVGLLVHREHEGDVREIGIETASSGLYPTACGQGYWVCGPEDSEKLDIRTSAIRVFRFEKAAKLIYWDPKGREFRLLVESE